MSDQQSTTPGTAGLPALVVFLTALLLFKHYHESNKKKIPVPIAGHYILSWEPQWFSRLRFIRSSRGILIDGYNKVKDSLFLIRRIGADVLVISNKKYLDEIRAATKDTVRSVEPFIHDFAGDLLGGLPFLQSDLQTRIVQQKLTPNLGNITGLMKAELEFAMEKEIPGCKGQPITIDPPHILARIVARISARILMGPEECRNEAWLHTTTSYAEHLFITGMILRMFPPFLRPFIAPLLPTYRAVRRDIATARKLVGGIIQSRRKAEQDLGSAYTKPEDCLQWMMDAVAPGLESTEADLSQRMLILSLSAIHTTALTMAQALYDLSARPEYLDPLREEVTQALQEEKDGNSWSKATLNRLRKLDSFLKESQRINPVFLLTFNRIYHQPISLSNGITLPSGTRVAVPAHAMLQDSKNIPGPASPDEFDGFRYSRLHEGGSAAAAADANANNSRRHMFAMTDSTSMVWGYGKYACPGRFYAADEIKMILGHLIMKYDFEFPEGKGRPRSFTIDGDMYPDRSARLIIRERKG